jgi:hypothetical protein
MEIRGTGTVSNFTYRSRLGGGEIAALRIFRISGRGKDLEQGHIQVAINTFSYSESH